MFFHNCSNSLSPWSPYSLKRYKRSSTNPLFFFFDWTSLYFFIDLICVRSPLVAKSLFSFFYKLLRCFNSLFFSFIFFRFPQKVFIVPIFIKIWTNFMHLYTTILHNLTLRCAPFGTKILKFIKEHHIYFFFKARSRFPYHYLVTTSSQLSNKPSEKQSKKSQTPNWKIMFENSTSPHPSNLFNFHDVTGGVYKGQVGIHHSFIICDYLRFHPHVSKFQKTIRTRVFFRYLLFIARTLIEVKHQCNTYTAHPIKVIQLVFVSFHQIFHLESYLFLLFFQYVLFEKNN